MTPKSAFTGLQALLVFPNKEDERAVRDLMRRFSAATRYAYQRLLEGKDREDLKRADGPLCTLFGLNTRQADDAILKAKAILDSAKKKGRAPRKVVFGGRGIFEQLKRKHLSGKPLRALKRRWREARQGTLYARGDGTKKGNPNLRLVVKGGALWLEVNLGERGRKARALVRTSHPNLDKLLERVYASRPYTVELSLKEGKVYAHFTWTEELPELRHIRLGGVLGIDINAHPYGLALALVGPDGNLKAHATLSLEEVDRAPNRGGEGARPLGGGPPGRGGGGGPRGGHRHGAAEVPVQKPERGRLGAAVQAARAPLRLCLSPEKNPRPGQEERGGSR